MKSNPIDAPRRRFLCTLTGLGLGAVAIAPPAFTCLVTGVFPALPKGKKKGDTAETTAGMPLAKLTDLPADGTPVTATVEFDATDAWVTMQRTGAVFLRRDGEKVAAFQVECPHLKCTVNYDAAKKLFYCPCHRAEFNLDGTRVDGAKSHSPRDLDSLTVTVTDDTVYVKYEEFVENLSEKRAV